MKEERKSLNLKLEIVEKLIALMASGFGLVAALAWNDAIQTLFREVFGQQSHLLAKFGYAALVTILVVLVTLRLSRLGAALKERLAAAEEREAETDRRIGTKR